HVADLARAHVLALEYLLKGSDSITVNLGSGRGNSVQQVIDTARALTGLEIVATRVQRRLGDPSILLAETTLAKTLFGWSAERSELSTVIADAWRWHAQRFGHQTKNKNYKRTAQQ